MPNSKKIININCNFNDNAEIKNLKSKNGNLNSKIHTFAPQTALSSRCIGEESPDTKEKHSG